MKISWKSVKSGQQISLIYDYSGNWLSGPLIRLQRFAGNWLESRSWSLENLGLDMAILDPDQPARVGRDDGTWSSYLGFLQFKEEKRHPRLLSYEF